MAVLPDPDLVELAIKRAHLQTFTWLCCYEQNVQTLHSEEFGWKLTDGELKPLWFNGDQFPPSITRRRQGKQTDGNDADSESSDPHNGPPKNKTRAQPSIIKSKKIKQITRKKKGYKKKDNDTKDKRLSPDGEEVDEELLIVTNSSTAACNTSSESDWEVSDFLSSDDSYDKRCPHDCYYILFLLLQ